MTEEERLAAEAAKAAETAAATGAPKEVSFESLDELLGVASATVLTGDSEPKKTIFNAGKPDLSFIDNTEDSEEGSDVQKPSATTVASILDAGLEDEEEEDKTPNTGGRPKLTKDAMIEAATRLIDKGVLSPFDDDKSLDQYTVDDFEELITANLESKIQEAAQKAPVELFQTLPEEVQAVVHYALNGGQDTKSVFNQLAKVQETFDLSVEDESDQEMIIRQWMNTLGTDSPEEIEEEINVIKDRGDLQKYAERYKPKLDAKQADLIKARLHEQEELKLRKEEAHKTYTQTIINTLSVKDLNGVPLNAQTQAMLYHGLVDSSKYQTVDGKPTNALGYLLEQHQFGPKPNPGLVAEALWLLANPDEYKNSLKTLGSKEAQAKTVKALKSEEQSRQTSSIAGAEGGKVSSTRTTLKRPTRSIFSK